MELSEIILFGSFADLELALSQGIEVNAHDAYGYTPLIEAVIVSQPKIVALLIEHGARVDDVDISGQTALTWAANYNDLELCELLLSQGANPNHCASDGQPILVNAHLRNNQALKDLFNRYQADGQLPADFIQAKLIGHRFELLGHADLVNARGEFFEIDFEGFYLEFTLGLIRDSFKDFIQGPDSRNFERLKGFARSVERALSQSALMMQRKYAQQKRGELPELRDLFNQDLVILPVSYEGHAITFVRFGNLLAKCDRGVNKFTDTIIIYEMRNELLFNAELMSELVLDNKSNQFIQNELKRLLDLKPLMSLPTKSQLSGNCSWANVEAAVPAALYMMLFKTLHMQRDKNEVKKRIMAFYQAWVEWDKDQALRTMLEKFHSVSPARQAASAAILASVLIQRCVHLKPRQVRRAQWIVPILMRAQYRYILQSYVSVYCTSRGGRLGENFTQLLKLCGQEVRLVSEHEGVPPPMPVRINSPLHIAARMNDLKTLKHLIAKQKIDVNLADSTGSTALMYAAWRGCLEIVEYLLGQGADIHLKNIQGGQALHYALMAHRWDVAKLLQAQSVAGDGAARR